ncbi:hypothetical protein NEOLEDRAFT_1065077 [Neolentinus lepideus HHB14362 ss-1]|uniref:BTB domain-containing protein n=1 Tax=Neolentinus lepideus HHB14362 ss-1 TaxID=1314782 RepID=A0A165SPQ0_9AGAM|nr:hypothetical protein NEOLEDRAFT_1065077 [Neolentinus lepideus HHB14362 ss-1]
MSEVQTDIRRHDSLYMHDGNIVLSTPNASGTVILFRVHQSILARISTVFADMLRLPTNGANEVYDGVPLVQMPDAAEDLESLLKVVYHENNLNFEKMSAETVKMVEPVLTMCNKYDIKDFRKQIISRMEGDWPTTLNAWDDLELEISQRWQTSQIRLRMAYCVDDILPEPVSAINLAHECNVPTILPAAFYHLSRLPLVFVRGTYITINYEEAGDAIFHDIAADGYLERGGRTASWQDLSSADHFRLMMGKESIRGEVRRLLDELLDASSSSICPSCPKDLISSFVDKTQRSMDRKTTRFDPLSMLCETVDKNMSPSACPQCRWRASDMMERLRETLWAKLPFCFHVKCFM